MGLSASFLAGVYAVVDESSISLLGGSIIPDTRRVRSYKALLWSESA